MVWKTLKRGVLVGTGAALMYFFDPDRGHGRRVRARDKANAAMRRRAKESRSSLKREMDREQGEMARGAGLGEFRPESQADLREHLRKVITDAGYHPNVNVDVVDGVASLRGEVANGSQMQELVELVGRVNGVVAVESYLHLPGTPAPNKAASERAGSN